MDSDIYSLARKYHETGNWRKAIENYKEYFKHAEDPKEESYVYYAQTLKKLNHLIKSEMILVEGNKLYPNNTGILKELIKLYQAKKEHSNANAMAKLLVKVDPTCAESYFVLGTTYASIKKKKKAKLNYLTGLEYKHDMQMKDIIKRIQSKFVNVNDNVSSEYNFVSGRSNYGSITHKFKKEKYFTKISNFSTLAKREELFYSQICGDFPYLKKYTPNFVDSLVLDNLSYLTIGYIESKPSNIENLKAVLQISQKISSISYQEIVDKYPNPNYSFQLKNKPNPMVIFFTQIHKKEINERLFDSLYKVMKENNYPKSLNKVINKLESLIMENYLYNFIDPQEHYSLLHGDFNSSNIRVSEEDQSIKVIDWETFKIGPHFLDIARYMSGVLLPYNDVKSIYLQDEKINNNLSLIEKIFFLYSIILLYILTIGANNIEKNIDKYITPALSDLEMYVTQFKQNEYSVIVESLLKENKKVNKKNQEINLLKIKIKETQEILDSTLNSKSWKLTAPLRKLMQWRNK